MEPQRTITALDRFKKAAGPKPERTITALDRFKTGTPITPPSPAPEPRGLFRTFAEKAPDFIASTSKKVVAGEKEKLAGMSAGEKVKYLYVTQPANIAKFLAQGFVGSLLSTGRTVQEALPKDIATVPGGSTRSEERQKELEKQILGGDNQSAQSLYRSIKGYVDESPDALPWEKKYAPIVLASAAFISDIVPSKPNGKKFSEQLLKELADSVDAADIEERMIREGIDPRLAARTAPRVANMQDSDEIKTYLRNEQANDVAEVFEGSIDETPNQTPNVPTPVRKPDDATSKPATEPVIQSIRRGETPAFGFDTKRLPDIVRKEIERFALKDVEFAREVNRAFNVSTKEDIANFLTNIPDGIDNDIAKTLTKNELIEELLDRVPSETILDIAEMRPSSAITPKTGEAGFIKNLFGKQKPEPVSPTPKQTKNEVVSSVNDTTPDLPTVNVGTKQVRINDLAPVEKLQADDTVIKDIKDMVRQDQQALRPTRATGNVTGRDLAEEMAGNIRRYNEKIPDAEVVKLREELLLNPETLLEVILRKRGVMTNEESIENAKLIQGTLEDIINLTKGTVLTSEQLDATRQIIANQEKIVAKLKQFLDEGGITGGKSERALLPKELRDASDDTILRQALAEATINLKKAQIVELGIRSEGGRALQAMKKYVEGVDNKLRILFKRVENSKKHGPAEKQAILEQIAKTDLEDPEKFTKLVDDLTETDFFDKFAEWSVAAKLWNPTTHLVNFGGNAIRQMVDMGIKLASNPMGAKAELMGAKHGLAMGLKRGFEALTNEGYAARLSKYVETGGQVPAIKGVKGQIARLPFRALGASDEIFSGIAYQRSLYRDAYAAAKKEGLRGKQLQYRMEELLNTPTLDMMERATNETKRMTFQEDMGEYVKMIDNLRDPSNFKGPLGKTGATGVRFFLPFLKTPVNLFGQAVDFSPFGIPKNYKKLKEARKAGDNSKVATIIGESIVGTAIAAYIAQQAMEGNVTGGAPKNPAEKDRFYRENKLPYAIKINGRWYQYQRLDPFALIMGMTADITNEKDPSFGNFVNTISSNLQDKTYLSGISDLIKLMSGEKWEQEASFKSMLLGAVMPSIIGHTARSIDPNVRVADTITERLMAQIPGLSQQLPSRVNVLGYDVERANKGLNYFFNPIQSTTAGIDPVTKELMKIDYSISVPNKTFTVDETDYSLNAEDYEDFARYTGIRMRAELLKMFKTPKYKRSDQEEKELMIDRMRTQIMKEWKEEYHKSKTKKGKSLDEIFNSDRSLLDVIFGN